MTAPAHLLDANVLIALIVQEHEFHGRARSWAASAGLLAVCPITEGALVRFLVRTGEATETISAILHALRQRCAFWPDDLSYADVDLRGVIGHRQVTDAYLAALAAHYDARLVTFDQALAASHPAASVLVP